MKKLLVLGSMIVVMVAGGITGCGKATKTTEYWDYNMESGEYELTETKEEAIDGLFDKKVIVRFGEVQTEDD